MKTMAVAWNGTTLNDKVKLLSVTELEASNSQAIIEGIQYPIFRFSSSEIYWLRTQYAASPSNYSWQVSCGKDHDFQVTTQNDATSGSTSASLRPCIRLG